MQAIQIMCVLDVLIVVSQYVDVLTSNKLLYIHFDFAFERHN